MKFADAASLEVFCGPLGSLVRNQQGTLVGILKHLAVLEVRFQQRGEEMDWTHDFDTATDLFHQVTTMTPRDLAGVLIKATLVYSAYLIL